jgi:hypothetical protein
MKVTISPKRFFKALNPYCVQIEPPPRIAGFFCLAIFAVGVPATAADADQLSIRIVDGQGAINNIRAHTARAPVVEVRDTQNRAVSGASVTFQTPFAGPGAAFGSERVLVTQTDSEGRAAGRGLVPNGVAGPFEIHVTASFNSQVVSTSIRQINASPAESRSSRKVLWISLAAGAAAGGVLAATHGHGSTSGVPQVPGTSLVAGASSFGPPQ